MLFSPYHVQLILWTSAILLNDVQCLILNATCSSPLGMESGEIEDFQITASSSVADMGPQKVSIIMLAYIFAYKLCKRENIISFH